MDEKFSYEPTPTGRLKLLSKEADVSVSSLGRLLAAEVGPTVDTLERIALAVDCSVSELLTADDAFLQAIGFPRTKI
jgi:transcriptional regulator with XRE-family HTH domain